MRIDWVSRLRQLGTVRETHRQHYPVETHRQHSPTPNGVRAIGQPGVALQSGREPASQGRGAMTIQVQDRPVAASRVRVPPAGVVREARR
jgi:hypothetical protein